MKVSPWGLKRVGWGWGGVGMGWGGVGMGEGNFSERFVYMEYGQEAGARDVAQLDKTSGPGRC